MTTKILTLLLFTSILITCFSNLASAQTMPVHKGRLYTSDGGKITFYDLIPDGNNYKYQVKNGDGYQEIDADKVLKIEKETGNEALVWGISFGISGLAGSLLGVSSSNSSENMYGATNHKAEAPIVISLTAVSALVGVLIGESKKKYTAVYTNPKVSTSLISNFNINFVFNNNLKGAGIKYAF